MFAHIDCNNFFVSCERLFRPDIANRPVAVLSNNDSCFISRSAEVKALGFPMGAPLFQYKQDIKLHNVTLFSANFSLYGEISERIVHLLQEETPLIEVYSIDECFLDLHELSYDDWTAWAEALQRNVLRHIGIPVSIGVGLTKTLAKVATTYAKKHGGIAVIDSDEMRREVLRQLPVEDVWGIGWRTAPKLRNLGISTAWQLVNTSDVWLKQQFNITGMKMVSELRGIRCLRFGDKRDKRQSIMVSRMFGHKIREYHQIESATASFATKASVKLRAQGSVCATVGVYLTTNRRDEQRRSVFKTVTLAEATVDTGLIITTALGLLSELYDPEFSYQKVAVTLSDITDNDAWQVSLVAPAKDRNKKVRLMQNVDALNHRFGSGAVRYAVEDTTHSNWQSKHALRSPCYTTRWDQLPVVKI